MNKMTEPQEKKKERFYNELKKIKTNAYNCFIFVLKIVILIREHKSLLMDNVIKDGSKDFSLKMLKLKIKPSIFFSFLSHSYYFELFLIK